jgi:hypothetical protein
VERMSTQARARLARTMADIELRDLAAEVVNALRLTSRVTEEDRENAEEIVRAVLFGERPNLAKYQGRTRFVVRFGENEYLGPFDTDTAAHAYADEYECEGGPAVVVCVFPR